MNKRKSAYYASGVILSVLCAGVVHAGQYWWAGGDGTWDTATANWKYGAADGVATNWPADDATAEAVFSGSGSLVTVSGTVVAGKVTMNSGGWNVTNGTVNLQGLATVALGSAVTSSVYSAITGTAGMKVDGAGVLTLGTNNTYTGGTVLTNQAAVMVTSINNTLGNGTTGNVVLNGGNLEIGAGSISAGFTPGWGITAGASGGRLINSTGYGWALGPSRMYGAGVLTLKSASWGLDTQSNFSGKWVFDGVTYIDYFEGNRFGSASGDDAITLMNNASVQMRSGTLGSASVGVTIGSGGARINQTAGSPSTIAGKISGAASNNILFTALGNAGRFTLTNTNNSYAGNTLITSGIVGVQVPASGLRLGASGVIPDGAGKGDVYIYNGGKRGIMDMNGFSETINGLSSWNGASFATDSVVDNVLPNSTSTLTVGGNDATSTFSGVIKNSGSGATLSLTKIGTGTLTLGGANTYTGVTTVSAGVLKLTKANGLSTDTVVKIASGAGSELAFTGTNTIQSLWVNGVMLGARVYGADNLPGVLSGSGYYKTLVGPRGTMIRVM